MFLGEFWTVYWAGIKMGPYSQGPYDGFLINFCVDTLPQLYFKLQRVAQFKMGLPRIPFELSDLLYPDLTKAGDISSFIFKCLRLLEGNNAEAEVIELTKYLKENPPQVSYVNPVLPEGPCTPEQKNLAQFIYCWGIDLPGSKHNLYGHLQYYSSFFIDMFFGNYTEFFDHIQTLSSKDLKKELNKREGYCQFSPIFAPILGLIMLNLENHSFITVEERKKVRLMYSGNNENQHVKILMMLLKLGADPNVHDIHGFTPLLHALYQADSDAMVLVLLNSGADPNCESIYGFRPLSMFTTPLQDHQTFAIDLLLQHNAKLRKKVEIEEFRTCIEKLGCKDLIIKGRKAIHRDKNECEKCVKFAEKKCSACGQVFYCSVTCQKQDWKYHKLACNKD